MQDCGQDSVGGKELEELPPSSLFYRTHLPTTALIHSTAVCIPETHRDVHLAATPPRPRAFYWELMRKLGFPGGSVVKNLPANAGDSGSIPGLGKSPGKGNGNPLQYSCLGNPMDRRAWWATVHGAANSWTGLSNSTTTRKLIGDKNWGWGKVLQPDEGGAEIKPQGSYWTCFPSGRNTEKHPGWPWTNTKAAAT